MKVLFLTTHLNTGGITSYLYTLAKGFIAQGHDVHIVSSSGDMVDDFKQLGVQLLELDVQTKSILSPKIYKAMPIIRKYINDKGIDIIHAQTRVTQVMAQCLSKETKCPFVATCHGFFRPRILRRLIPCWGNRTIAISNAVKEHLVNDFKVDQNNIRCVYSGVDVDQFTPVEQEIRDARRKELGVSDNLVVGIVARLSDVKGQDILLQAFAKVIKHIDQARLLIVGQGKLKNLLHDLVNEFNLKDHVTFYNDLNRTAYYLSAFDVYANPSRQEGLGISVMEAQVMGLPVVASNIGGIPSLITHEQTGYLVEPQNVEQLADCLVKVLQNREAAHQVGEAARKNVLKHYTSQQMIDGTLAVYKELVS